MVCIQYYDVRRGYSNVDGDRFEYTNDGEHIHVYKGALLQAVFSANIVAGVYVRNEGEN